MLDEDTIQIRSYRVCFDLERRIHKIDRWRVPLPYGVPVRGLAYAGVTLLAVAILSSFPAIGQLLGLLHPGLRFIALPIGAATMLTRWSVDGRQAHRVGMAWLRHQLQPARIAAFRRSAVADAFTLDEVTVAGDDRSSRLRPATVRGPARVIFRNPVRTTSRGRVLLVKQESDEVLWRGTQVDLSAGQRLVIR